MINVNNLTISIQINYFNHKNIMREIRRRMDSIFILFLFQYYVVKGISIILF